MLYLEYLYVTLIIIILGISAGYILAASWRGLNGAAAVFMPLFGLACVALSLFLTYVTLWNVLKVKETVNNG